MRFDSGFTSDLSIEPYYDSLIAKIITRGRTRGDAIKIMARALKEFQVEGVKTTIALHQRILEDDFFRTGNIDTQFIKNRLQVYETTPSKRSLKELKTFATKINEINYENLLNLIN